MQISSSSLRTSSHSLGCRAFTLIELLVSAAIITLVSSVVLVRFDSFDSTVLLKSLAYEVATTVREAQIYSVSVINTLGGDQESFRYPYGLSFTPGEANYNFFRYNNTSTSVTPKYDIDEITLVRNILIGNSMEIYDVCITIGGSDDCDITRLDVSFRRPEYSAVIYTPSVSQADLLNISAAKVLLRSTKNTTNVWVVEVTLLGQIVVYKQ